MFFVYVLQSGNHRYIGRTNNLKRRITEHNAGNNLSTKAYLPWKLVYFEAHLNQDDAKRREGYFKTSTGRISMSRMIQSYLKSTK